MAASSELEPFGVTTDADGRVASWPAEAEALLGFPRCAVVGRPLQEVLEPRDLFGNLVCVFGNNLEEMVRRGEPIRPFVTDVRTKGGGTARLVIVGVTAAAGEGFPKSLSYRMRGDHRSRLQRREFDQHAVASLLHAARAGDAPAGAALTTTEMKVLKLLIAGCGTTRLASVLQVSPATARNHIQHIRRKLGVHTRLEAVSVALHSGIV